MNLWPYTAVSAVAIAFCAFLVWISPSSTQTAIAVVGLVAGWWFTSPGEIVQKAMVSMQPVVHQPVEHSNVQKEQA
jgi:hypothetical protein